MRSCASRPASSERPRAPSCLVAAALSLAPGLAADAATDRPGPVLARPRIAGCPPRAVAGGTVCVCGSFPAGTADGLTLDGRPAQGRTDASGRVASLSLPPDLSPGVHVIGGDPALGFPAADQVWLEVVRVQATVDPRDVVRGQETTVEIRVEGTQERVALRLRNQDDGVASLESGDEQVGVTSGGSPNRLLRRAQGKRAGRFRVDYTLGLAPCPCALGMEVPVEDARDRPFHPRRVLALIPLGAPEAMASLARAIAGTHGLEVLEVHPLVSTDDGLVVFAAARAEDVLLKVAALRGDPRVRAAQPDLVHETAGVSDTGSPLEWGLRAIHGDQLPAGATGEGVTLALVDTGVDADHVALRGRVAARVDMTGAGFTPDAHGTLLAGIVAAQPGNALGLRGVAPGVRLLAVKACQPESTQAIKARCGSAALARGVDHAVQGGAQVLNLSVAGSRDDLLARVLDAARRRGVVAVAAAGHEAGGSPPFPAAWSGVLAATAVDALDRPYAPASRGSFVDLAAPGVEVVSSAPGGRAAAFSGTSAAAAFVSGSVALVLQQQRGLTPAAVQALLEQSARDLGPPGKDPQFGSGRLDACRALARATGGSLVCP